MRITWRSIDWLSEDYRQRIAARLESMADEGGGADRVEITSRPVTDEVDACTEVRISGVIKKCQLTAVREHHAPERALNDALDAFGRNVAYALQARRAAAAAEAASESDSTVPAGAFAVAGGIGGSSLGSVVRFAGSFGDVLRPVSSLVDRVRGDAASVLSVVSSAARRGADMAPSRPKRAPRRKRRQAVGIGRMPQAAMAAAAVVLAAGGAWWMQDGETAIDLPQVALQAAPGLQAAVVEAPVTSRPARSEEPVAYWAIAGEGGVADADRRVSFSAVATRTAGLSSSR